jgi:hypothetical protein
MQKLNGQEYGIGNEMEGFIVNGSRGQERIAGISAAEWIQNKFSEKFPQLADHVSLEEASVMLEVKTAVFAHRYEAIRQVQEIRALINQLLAPHGCSLKFIPVLTEPFEFVPASSDPNSRSQQLMKEWGQTPEGLQMMYSTAIAGYQINDSRPLMIATTDQARMEIARNIHNLYSQNFDEVIGQNIPFRNYEGKTRLDILYHLMTGVKAERFARHGYDNPMVSLIPPYFATIKDMQRWMTAHTKDAQTFADAVCKNEHAATVKIKRDPYWAIETRAYDAVDSEVDMRRISDYNEKFLQPFLPA